MYENNIKEILDDEGVRISTGYGLMVGSCKHGTTPPPHFPYKRIRSWPADQLSNLQDI